MKEEDKQNKTKTTSMQAKIDKRVIWRKRSMQEVVGNLKCLLIFRELRDTTVYLVIEKGAVALSSKFWPHSAIRLTLN